MTTLREHISAALEQSAAHCSLDRETTLDVIMRAIASHPDAELVRAAFAKSPTGRDKSYTIRGLGWAGEAQVLSAAARLAQAKEVLP